MGKSSYHGEKLEGETDLETFLSGLETVRELEVTCLLGETSY